MQPSYSEYAPSPALAGFVECYWSRHSLTAGVPAPLNRVIPDGCMDIVFSFGDPWTSATGRGHRGGAVVGTMTTPLVVHPGRREEFFGVRFRPGRARAFFGIPAAEYTDASLSLPSVWGREGADMEDRLASCTSPPARVAAMERELLRRLAADAGQTDCYVDAVVNLVMRHGGAVSVSAAAAYAGVTRQHLARRFEQYIGIRPKLFSRVVRFQNLLARLRGLPAPVGTQADWSGLALDAGYYDQSHLIADFRQFSGLTPEEFRSQRP